MTVRREAEQAVLSVSDDGAGIPPDQQEKIWQRFYQVDAARSGGEGTGLGLYMVRQIARLHGGTAEVGERARAGQHIHRADPGGMTYISPPAGGGKFFFISPLLTLPWWKGIG